MRKLPGSLDNPVDDLLLYGVEAIMPLLVWSKITPNAVTLLSGVAGAASVGLVTQGQGKWAAIAYMLSYFWDCVDGFLARSTNQVTSVGDTMDHLKDVSVALALFYALYFSGKVPRWALLLLVALAVASLVQMGCQEKVYGRNESRTLNFTRSLCAAGDPEGAMGYTRWFGMGTLTLAACWVMWRYI